MKTSIFIVLILFGFLRTYAQDYLISFTGAGDTTAIGTIKVYNLTSGDSVTLYGGDILHLKLPSGIGVMDASKDHIKIYPNPMNETAVLTIIAPTSGNVNITLSNITGKIISQSHNFLYQGISEFRITGLKQGIYVVKVNGSGYQYSAKLVSQGNSESRSTIEPLSSEQLKLSKKTGQPKSPFATIDMSYTTGDILLYKSISGQYSTIITDIPSSSKTVTVTFTACRDTEGHTYATLLAGTQLWMAANLNVGTKIQDTTNQNNNGIIEKYCYENKESNCTLYGGLYQWGEMMSYDTVPGSQGICPSGWHIPTDAEWGILMTWLGGDSIAGGKMKETGTLHWAAPNTGATNESGFTALPGGYSYYSGTLFMTDYAVFWSSSESGTSEAWYWLLQFNYKYVTRRAFTKENGYSVRCLKN
jgi:uncharacterized protein (TIGR02145 family)